MSFINIFNQRENKLDSNLNIEMCHIPLQNFHVTKQDQQPLIYYEVLLHDKHNFHIKLEGQSQQELLGIMLCKDLLKN